MNKQGHEDLFLSVVIVNWNVKQFLKECLDSIYRYTRDLPFEVFVVDNGSRDGSAEMVKNDFPQARLIANEKNLGFSAANNQAFKECRGSFILLLNPDTRLLDNAPLEMIRFLEAHPDAWIVGPKLIFPDGSVYHSTRGFPSLWTDFSNSLFLDSVFPKSTVFNAYRMGFWGQGYTRPVDMVAGACMMMRRKVLDKAGLMDERFFMYYDEVDLSYRVKKQGGKIYFFPAVSVIHHSNKSSEQSRKDSCRWKTESMLRFFQKHYGGLSVCVLLVNLILRSFLAWGIFGITHFFFGVPKDPEFIRAEARMLRGCYFNFLNPRKGG